MNKEEQEIIEKFKNAKTQNYQEVIRKIKHDNINDIAITRKEYIDVLLNYIDKLQKENKELKEEIEHQYKQYIKDHTEVIENLKKEQELKIRNKIKELEEIYNNTDTLEIDKKLMINAEIIVLEELLGDE